MATILTKRSNTASSVPLAGDLTNSTSGAELAVNTADKRVFTKDSGGTVVELGTNPSSLTLNGGTANGLAFLNASKVLTTGSALTFNGTVLTSTGTDGFQSAAGGLSAYFYADSVGGNISVPGNNALRAYINGSEQMRLTSTGLGIGTSSPSQKLQVSGGSPRIWLQDTTSGGSVGELACDTSSFGIFNRSNLPITFGTNNTLRMTLDSSGNLLVGGTTVRDSAKITNEFTTGSNGLALYCVANTNAVDFAVFRANAGSLCGNIARVGTTNAVVYASASDYRLKENIAPMTGALAKVAQLKPVTYNWKDGGAAADGFIAHELAEVCPSAVVGAKDAVDSDGNPKYQSVDTSFLVATLTAAIQEQQAIINAQASALTALTARVAALESN